ncbi:MAG TPA: hypothetical protein VJB88_07770, partial [Vicinamibacteria bacterium]|nr:hypothetical protein [Vicinamibacteria bacterium]
MSKNGILLVEDKAADTRIILQLLTEFPAERHGVTHVRRLDEALRVLGVMSFKAALVDVSLPDNRGLEAVA